MYVYVEAGERMRGLRHTRLAHGHTHTAHVYDRAGAREDGEVAGGRGREREWEWEGGGGALRTEMQKRSCSILGMYVRKYLRQQTLCRL